MKRRIPISAMVLGAGGLLGITAIVITQGQAPPGGSRNIAPQIANDGAACDARCVTPSAAAAVTSLTATSTPAPGSPTALPTPGEPGQTPAVAPGTATPTVTPIGADTTPTPVATPGTPTVVGDPGGTPTVVGGGSDETPAARVR